MVSSRHSSHVTRCFLVRRCAAFCSATRPDCALKDLSGGSDSNSFARIYSASTVTSRRLQLPLPLSVRAYSRHVPRDALEFFYFFPVSSFLSLSLYSFFLSFFLNDASREREAIQTFYRVVKTLICNDNSHARTRTVKYFVSRNYGPTVISATFRS